VASVVIEVDTPWSLARIDQETIRGLKSVITPLPPKNPYHPAKSFTRCTVNSNGLYLHPRFNFGVASVGISANGYTAFPTRLHLAIAHLYCYHRQVSQSPKAHIASFESSSYAAHTIVNMTVYHIGTSFPEAYNSH
jgi:hypothetical protein